MADDVIASLHRLRYAIAADAVLQSLERLDRACKANFDPNQPRVPAGNRDGGQWTSTGGGTGVRNDPRVLSDAMPDDAWTPGAQYAANRTHGGHHFVPGGVFRKYPFPNEARQVLDQARTGRLEAGPHGWSKGHKQYNDAIESHVDDFLRTNKIEASEMTPDEARKLVQSVKESKDPRIRDFNLRIYLREIMHQLRRGPRRLD